MNFYIMKKMNEAEKIKREAEIRKSNSNNSLRDISHEESSVQSSELIHLPFRTLC